MAPRRPQGRKLIARHATGRRDPVKRPPLSNRYMSCRYVSARYISSASRRRAGGFKASRHHGRQDPLPRRADRGRPDRLRDQASLRGGVQPLLRRELRLDLSGAGRAEPPGPRDLSERRAGQAAGQEGLQPDRARPPRAARRAAGHAAAPQGPLGVPGADVFRAPAAARAGGRDHRPDDRALGAAGGGARALRRGRRCATWRRRPACALPRATAAPCSAPR